MAESIETFVEKLQQEGVQAGRNEAQKLIDEARGEAERLVSEAKEQADRILERARAESDQTLKQGRDELELAARDALLRLRETLSRSLRAVLARASAEALEDEGFLRKLLEHVVAQYAGNDAEGSMPLEVHVNEKDLKSLTDWAIREMAPEDSGGAARVDLKGDLKSAGFEYSLGGGTVEVTPESVAAVLSQMIAPRLREFVEKAAGREQ